MDVTTAGVLTIEQCESGKKNIIVNNIETKCGKNKRCMVLVATDIENGVLPLQAAGNEAAWDYFNFYKDLDKDNLIMPVEPDHEPKNYEDLSPEEKEIEKVFKEIGAAIPEK